MRVLGGLWHAFRLALRREDGQVLILQVMVIVVLMGVLGFVVDGGKLMVAKRQAQSAVDASALAAAAHATLDPETGAPTCGPDCEAAAADYLQRNNQPSQLCSTDLVNCFVVTAPYKVNMVRVVLYTDESTIFAGLLGVGTISLSASAAATTGPQTGTVTTPGQTYVTTSTYVAPGAPASIFVRASICQSFFFPGVGNHVTGVVTNGGVGSFPAGNQVDSIQMNYYWYEQGCYPDPKIAGVPRPPSFWQYDANGNPLDGPGPDAWVVPFPDLSALFSSNDPAVHCVYSSHKITGEVSSPDSVTATTDGPHCLRAGDQVTVSFANSRLGDGTLTVTGTTATTFTYAKTGVGFFRTVTKKALKTGVATLTLSGTSPVFVKGDVIAVSGVDSTFNCARCTVTAVSNSSVSYAIPGALDVTAVNSGGRVDFIGSTGTELHGAIPSITSTWKAQNLSGIYVIDAPYGTALTISASNTVFDGYTWVAPEILLSGIGNTYSNYPGAPQSAVFYAYNPNGDAVHESGSTIPSHITGSIFCGPPEPNASNPNPTNKCWFGADHTTFTGLLEAWHIEWKLDYGDFNGTGPAVGTTTGTTTFTVENPGQTQTVITGTTVGGLGE